MILPVHDTLRRRIADVLRALYGLESGAQPPIIIQYPPTRAMGDLAVPLAFELAKRLRKAPRAIAQDLAGALGSMPGVTRIEATGQGYLNIYLERPGFLRDRLPGSAGAQRHTDAEKTIVEHTAINPNKAAHIGHLRNAALGDMLVRLLKFRDTPVEVHNYIDDTGVQVADVVVGFQELEHRDLAAVRDLADQPRFDYYCWDLYARVTEWYEGDKDRLKHRAAALHAIEKGGNDTAAMAALVADRIVRRHLQTLGRLNVDYDLLTWEGDILRLQFWARAFEILKESGAVFLQTEGRLAGCWVMKIEEDAGSGGSKGSAGSQGSEGSGSEGSEEGSQGSRGSEDSASAETADEEQREKVIVRSDGTVTYVGKDIAYQFWKFGLLGRDFKYRVFATRADGTHLWATTSEPTAAGAAPPPFGRAARVYNVIDTRQEYLQKLLKQALATMGYVQQAAHSTHFSYGMVALTHATARHLGYETGESAGRPFVEVSGRKGLGVKADDLLDQLIDKAHEEVVKRNPDLAGAEARRIAEMIAVAAVRYFMVKYSLGKVIAFDIDEALSFEGESGPYLQYAAVRANNIFQKLQDRLDTSEADVQSAIGAIDAASLVDGDDADELWGLVLEAARLDEVAEQAVRTLELSIVAKYAFGLAQAFNAFYHRFPIINEEREPVRLWRAAVASYFKVQMTRAINLMGFEVPPRM